MDIRSYFGASTSQAANSEDYSEPDSSDPRSFSEMKLIKTRLCNALSDCSLYHLMKIAIEAPGILSDNDLEEIVNVWQRKSRRVSV